MAVNKNFCDHLQSPDYVISIVLTYGSWRRKSICTKNLHGLTAIHVDENGLVYDPIFI